MSLPIPFHTQYWNLDAWEELGFKSRKEALYWQNSSCGVLCLKMAIEGITGKDFGISALIRTGERLGAYSHKQGWSHDGLARLAQEMNVEAFSREHMTVQNVKDYIDDGCLAIVSIKSAFEAPKKSFKERLLFWKKSGGHLALVIGYNEQGFLVHHTSTLEEYNWGNTTIPFQKFERAFTGRGVIVQPL